MKSGFRGIRTALSGVGRRLQKVVRSRRFWLWTGGTAAVIIVLQLIFPYDRAFFLARVDGEDVSLQTRAAIEERLRERYAAAEVVTENPTTKQSFTAAGVDPDVAASAAKATTYPVWQRLIPLSSLYRLVDREQRSVVSYHALPLSQWAKKVAEACAEPAVDATIAATADGTLGVVPSKKGARCDEKELINNLKSTTLATTMKVDSVREVVEPKRTDQAVSAQLDDIQKVIDQGISVKILGTETKAEPRDIVSWLTFRDGENGSLELDVDPAKLEPFIGAVQQPIYIAPGTTVITMHDGRETSRVAGAAGRGIDRTALVASIREQLRSLKTAPIEAKVAAIPPREDIRRSYSNTTAGLQALLNDLAAEKGDMAIAITELSGQKRFLSANGGRQYHPASTYKLFMAYSVIKRIEANQLKWDDQINGRSVEACVETMIVHSDNACAEAFAEKFTWGAVQADVRATGATSTNLNLSEPVATVTDQVMFLRKLHDKQLMNQAHTDKLLGYMKRQIHRGGIPSGASGEVADKVGFLSGLLHDSAIVYAPSGTYLLSIYSKGGTWGDIADVTRRIQALIAS